MQYRIKSTIPNILNLSFDSVNEAIEHINVEKEKGIVDFYTNNDTFIIINVDTNEQYTYTYVNTTVTVTITPTEIVTTTPTEIVTTTPSEITVTPSVDIVYDNGKHEMYSSDYDRTLLYNAETKSFSNLFIKSGDTYIPFTNVTPKIILNKIWDEHNARPLTLKEKLEIIEPGINAIDIDWNGAILENGKQINTTADLIAILNDLLITGEEEQSKARANYWDILDGSESVIETYTGE